MALKKALGQSTALMGLAASGNSVISFVIFIILSRILSPEDIGLVAFALIFVEAGKIIVSAGFPQAIVQHKVWDHRFASTCFHLNFLFATLVAVLVFAVGAPLAARYYQAEAGPILQVLSVVFFIEGVKAVHEGKLKREFVFRSIAIRAVVGGLAGGITGVYLALSGYGVWALVWQQVVNHLVVSTFTILSARWTPSLLFSREDCRHLLRFSTPLMMAQLIGNVSSKIFDLLVGVVIGPAALGFLRVGGRAVFILQDIVLKPFEHTALSALSRIADRRQQATGTLRLIRMSLFLTLPIFFGAAAIGSEFIVFAFGEKWVTAGSLMTALAIGTAPLVIGYQINAALTASGHARLVMAYASIGFVLNVATAALSVPFGLLAAACGYAVRCYVSTFIYFWFFRRVFGVSLRDQFALLVPTYLASLIMFGLVMLIKHVLTTELSAGWSLVALGVAGGSIYILLMVTLFRGETRNFFREGIDLAPAKFRPMIVAAQRVLRLN